MKDWIYLPRRQPPRSTLSKMVTVFVDDNKEFLCFRFLAETGVNTCGLLGDFSHFWHHCVILLDRG